MGTSDVRVERIGQIMTALSKWTSAHYADLYSVGMEAEDFQQEVILNILSRSGLDKFDESKLNSGSFDALIWSIARRHMIDLKRARFAKSRVDAGGAPISPTSIDQEVPGTEGLCLVDLIAADEDLGMAYLEMASRVPSTQISPNYDLTWATLFRDSATLDASEIAQQVGISESRVKQLQKQLVRDFLS